MNHNPIFSVDIKWVIPLFELVREKLAQEWRGLPLISRGLERERFMKKTFRGLNLAFKKYKVKFISGDAGAAAYHVWNNWIVVSLEERDVEAFFKWRYDFFTTTLRIILTRLRTSIAHELIHRHQYVVAKWKEGTANRLVERKPDTEEWDEKDWEVYLSDAQEIMAHAHDAVQDLLMLGWSVEKVITHARMSQWPRRIVEKVDALYSYTSTFEASSPTWAVFMANVIEYAEEEKEGGGEEERCSD